MTTITWTRGETRRYGVATDADAAQLRISLPSQCRTIEGVPVTLDGGGAGFAFVLDDDLLDLPMRPYRVTVWTRTGTEWLCRATHLLDIKGGC